MCLEVPGDFHLKSPVGEVSRYMRGNGDTQLFLLNDLDE